MIHEKSFVTDNMVHCKYPPEFLDSRLQNIAREVLNAATKEFVATNGDRKDYMKAEFRVVVVTYIE